MQTTLNRFQAATDREVVNRGVFCARFERAWHHYALEMLKPRLHHPSRDAAEFGPAISSALRTPMAGKPSKGDLEQVVPLTEATFEAWGAGDEPTRERMRTFLVIVAVHWLRLRSRHGECMDEELAMKAGEKTEESLQKKVASKEITFLGQDKFFSLAARKIRWEFIALARVLPDRFSVCGGNQAGEETLSDIFDSIAGTSASPAEVFREEAKRERYVRAVANFFSRRLSQIHEDTQRLVRFAAHRETLHALVLYVKSAFANCVPHAVQQAVPTPEELDSMANPVNKLIQHASFDELSALLLKEDKLCFDHRDVSSWIRKYLDISQAAWNQRVKRLRQMFLLSESDLLDGVTLCVKLVLAGNENAPSPMRRMWELLPDPAKQIVRQVAQSRVLPPADRKIIIEELNRMLAEAGFCKEPCFANAANIAVTAVSTINQRGQMLAVFQTQALNRQLIEAACPGGIATGPDFRPYLLDWLSSLGLLGRPSTEEESTL